jgi:hypothetical protein
VNFRELLPGRGTSVNSLVLVRLLNKSVTLHIGSPRNAVGRFLSWLALALTPGLASRLSARVLKQFGSPDGVFHASPSNLEPCHLPAPVVQGIVKKVAFKRAEKELAGVRKIAGCAFLNWTEPEYPQTLLQIYDPPILLSGIRVRWMPMRVRSECSEPSMVRKKAL